jgi:ribosomal-protein-alanine N-acetyltransferase
LGKMDHKIILETDRLLFRQHIAKDMDAYCAMEMDPDVRLYTGGNPRTREEAEKRFKGMLEPVKGPLGMWATVFKPENVYVGRCGIYPHFKPGGGVFEGEAGLGLYIASGYWGRGIATEAGNAFVKFGFDELKLSRIVTAIDTRNDVSVHVLKKLGFELVSTETGERSFYHFAKSKH